MIFKIVAGWASLYHGVLGLIGIFAGPQMLSSVITLFYKANIEITPQVFYLIKFCSAYMIAFAIVMFLLAKNPLRYKNLIWVPITLFSVRILERLFFTDILVSDFGIAPKEEIVTNIIIVVMISLLVIFRPRESKK